MAPVRAGGAISGLFSMRAAGSSLFRFANLYLDVSAGVS